MQHTALLRKHGYNSKLSAEQLRGFDSVDKYEQWWALVSAVRVTTNRKRKHIDEDDGDETEVETGTTESDQMHNLFLTQRRVIANRLAAAASRRRQKQEVGRLLAVEREYELLQDRCRELEQKLAEQQQQPPPQCPVVKIEKGQQQQPAPPSPTPPLLENDEYEVPNPVLVMEAPEGDNECITGRFQAPQLSELIAGY